MRFFVAINVGVEVLGPASVLFNEVLGNLYFKLARLVLKACWLFSNETPAGIYLLKVNNRNTKTRCAICSKLTMKIPEQRLASLWYLYC